MKRIIYCACICVAMLILYQSKAFSECINYKGARHNGVFLNLSKVEDLKGRAVRLHFDLECRKNWGGSVSGEADIEVFHFEKADAMYNPSLHLSCYTTGPGGGVISDGGIKRDIKRGVLTIRISISEYERDCMLLSDIDKKSKCWEVHVTDTLSTAINKSVRELQRGLAGVRDQIIKAAIDMGLTVTIP